MQRAEAGLKTPTWEAKEYIWKRVRSETAGVRSGYAPIAAARDAHRADAAGVALSGGWRSGKSLASGMEGVAWLPYADLIWLVARDYDLTRQEFIYLAEGGISTGLVAPDAVQLPMNKYQPCALRTITGGVVETRTLADFRKIAARPPDLVIVCEPGLIENLLEVMELLWGRVAERRGCIWLAGTSDESSEEWFQLWESWQRPNAFGGVSFSIPSWQNIHRFPKGRDERVFRVYEQQYGNDALMAHYGGVPSAPRDLVLRGYWKYDMHVRDDVVFSTDYPVEIAVDPNYSLGNRYVVEAVQWNPMGREIRIVDEIALEGCTHDEVRQVCEDRPWWPYVYGGTIDPYAAESHIFGSPAPVTYWQGLALRVRHRPRVNSTVQALKEAMLPTEEGPRLRITPKAERFVYEASRWRQTRQGKPSEKDCDALKATGYWLVDRFTEERLMDGGGMEDNIVVARDFSIE